MKKETSQVVPAARQEGLIVQELSDEVLVYDEQRHKAHCLNQTAAVVWRQCDGQRGVKEVAQRASAEMGATVGEEMVWLAVEELGKRRLLTERQNLGMAGASRREMMKRLGIGAAVALPLITTIVAPEAAQAANCIASGQACTSSAQCCSGLCSSSLCA
jgi:hypothetical protein